jgi:hypothetical protein
MYLPESNPPPLTRMQKEELKRQKAGPKEESKHEDSKSQLESNLINKKPSLNIDDSEASFQAQLMFAQMESLKTFNSDKVKSEVSEQNEFPEGSQFALGKPNDVKVEMVNSDSNKLKGFWGFGVLGKGVLAHHPPKMTRIWYRRRSEWSTWKSACNITNI